MPKVKVKLLRPLDGRKEGSVASFDAGEAAQLAGFGAVQILGPAKEPRARALRAAPQDVQRTKRAPRVVNKMDPALVNKAG